MAGLGYDIIGDIHGCNRTLEQLLVALGYRCVNGVYRHEHRQVVFLGDFIDRGLGQREVKEIVRPMIDSRSALTVMGNHEFNAIAWHTRHPVTGEPLRAHSKKNRRQHTAFLDAYGENPAEHRELITWFQTLPLWLDLGEIRIVHACWDPTSIELGRGALGETATLDDGFLVRASEKDSPEYEGVETLLKGKEIPLPDGRSFNDKDGSQRRNIRVRWWSDAPTYREAFLGPESAVSHIPDDPILGDHLLEYGPDEPPVFIGHYWLEGDPAPLAPNIACLDYSVANPRGKLVAYRWDGESALSAEKFVAIERQEPPR
jgi:hypothetical protein